MSMVLFSYINKQVFGSFFFFFCASITTTTSSLFFFFPLLLFWPPPLYFFSWLTTNFYSVFILFSVNPFPALTHRQKIYWLNRLSPNESTIQKQMFLDSFQNTFLYTYIYTHIHLYLSYMYVLGMFSIFLYIREFPKKQIWKKSN